MNREKNDEMYVDSKLPTLSEALKSKLETLKKSFADVTLGKHDTEIPKDFSTFALNDATILRFLLTAEGNCERAEKLLRAHLQWRESFCPQQIGLSDVKKYLETGVVRNAGRTRDGKPIVLINVKNFKPSVFMNDTPSSKASHSVMESGAVEFTKMVIYMFETNLYNFPEGCHTGVLIFDFEGFNRSEHFSQAGRLQFNQLINMVQEHYPERMQKIYMLNYPWWFGMVYKIIEALMSKSLKSKLVRVGGTMINSSTGEPYLSEMADIDPSVLPKKYGGEHGEYPLNV